MAPPPPAGAGEEDLLEVRCAGCGETLEVERGLTEFICPDCSTPQGLPPELMPPPPPRRRRALPIPPAPAPSQSPPAARLPCGSCGSMLAVPPGLGRCGCPVCGAELAVDPARLRQYLLSTAAAPLVPVSLPPVYRALERGQHYSDPAVLVGHIQGRTSNQLGHLERSQATRQNTQALLEFPDDGTDSDDIDTEISNEINETPCHRNGFPVASRTVRGAKGRRVETPNYVTGQAHAQQSDHSVHAEHPSDHTFHVAEAQNESANHGIHRGLRHVEPIKAKPVGRHSNQVTGTAIGPKFVSVEKRQVQTSKRITQGRQQKTSPPKLPSPIAQDAGHSNDNIQAEQDEAEVGRRQNTQELLEFPDDGTDSDDMDTEMSNEINEMPCHGNGFPVASRTVTDAKGRQVETLNYVTCQVHVHQSDHSVHAEHPSDHTIHVAEAQNESANHGIHRGLRHVEPIKVKPVGRHSNQVTGTAIGPKILSVEKREVQTSKQITRDRQQKTSPPKLPSPVEQDPGHSNDSIQAEQDEAEVGQVTARLARKSTKRNLTSSDKGLRHRRSKRLAKQSAATTYYKAPENESEENEAVSPSRTVSDFQDIDGVSNDISSSSLPQHDRPHRRSNEADNAQATTKSASIPDVSDPESFARHYSKTYPPEVRRALERNSILGQAGGKENRKSGNRGPTLCLKVWTRPEGVRIRVPFNDHGKPIGDEARTLSNFLGQIARDGTVAPLTYTDWRFFPEKNKEAMMHLVNHKFVLPPVGQIWSMSALGEKWKHWKVALKRDRYDAHETDAERLADRDFRVPEEQWKLLVSYWGTEKAKALSARCKASHVPSRNHPRLGSKSYARIQEEERQKRANMAEPSITDTSTPEDREGRPVPMDDVSAEIVSSDQ